MKSYKQWQNRKLYQEFVGPRGQIDPLGATPQPASPMAPPAADASNDLGNVQHLADRMMQMLAHKPANEIIQAQQHLNTAFQQLLMTKGNSAARRGLNADYNSVRTARQSFGQSVTPLA